MTADETIGDILIADTAFWSLSPYTLSVDVHEHHLDDTSQSGPGATNLVDHYEQIIWDLLPRGTIFSVR